jgi:hypothetical protein
MQDDLPSKPCWMEPQEQARTACRVNISSSPLMVRTACRRFCTRGPYLGGQLIP